MVIFNDQTLSRLAYRKLSLTPEYRMINSSYLFDKGTIPYIKHRSFINKVKEMIFNSDGGAFLITGFRGVGKSTLVRNAVSELNIEKKSFISITATIILSSEKTYAEILFEVIRRLYEDMLTKKVWKKLSLKTRNRIKLAYARTSLCIKQSKSVGTTNSISLAMSKVINSDYNSKATFQAEEEATYLAFSEQDVEYELIQIIEAFHSERPTDKVLIIVDEIDKLTCDQIGLDCFETTLKKMKNLVSAATALFIFVAGIDVYERWELDNHKINSLYDSLFSWHLYLPCIWDSFESLFDTIINKAYVYEPIDEHFKDKVQIPFTKIMQPPFRFIANYIFFKGKGIPRKIISAYNDFVFWDNSKPYFMLTSKLTRGIVQISKLCEKFYSYANKATFRTIIDKDIYYSVFLSMLEFLFHKPNIPFSLNDIKKSLFYENELLILNFDKVVDDLINVFISENIIKENALMYEVIDASILQRDKSISIIDANILLENQKNIISEKSTNMEFSPDIRFHEQIATLQSPDVINFWKPFKATHIISVSETLMSFEVLNKQNKERYYAILYTPEYRERIRKFGSLYGTDQYSFCNSNLIDTTDIIKEGSPLTSLRKSVEGYLLSHIICAKFKRRLIYIIIRQVFEFLDFLHRNGFFNVRIKPDNLWICLNGHLKILDLQHICKINGTSNPYPTKIYSAPEIYDLQHNPASDYYAVAVLLFELIFGKNLDNICCERQIDIKYHINDLRCSHKLKETIKKSLEFDIANRFASPKEFFDALSNCPEFRLYKNSPIPQGEKGIVTNYILSSFQVSADFNKFTHQINSTEKTENLGGYFGGTRILESSLTNKIMVYLLRVKSNEIIKIEKSVFQIGKTKDSVDYRIKNNPSISRIHASIIVRSNQYFVRDHNSTNKTYLNGIVINPNTDVEIKENDNLRLANEEFVFKTQLE